MAQSDTPAGGETLQFDRAVTEAGGAGVPPSPVVVCAGCKVKIQTQYYDVNGNALCGTCRAAVAAAAETPKGWLPLLKAAGFGAGAGVVGAAIYYAVIAIAHLEIGIVAILIGYMVGYSVRKGAAGRGGRRFQVLAAVLTYLAVALAYAPLAVQEAMGEKPAAAAATASAPGTEPSTQAASRPAEPRPAEPRPSGRRLLLSLAVFSGLMVALPVLVVIGSFPSGLISALIIFIGMRQAWKMTSAPVMRVVGPYRIGGPQAAAS
jgi:hypothetical protein